MADRESIIRCLELEQADYKLDIDRLQMQVAGMVPKSQYHILEEEHHQATLKIKQMEFDIEDLRNVVDRANLDQESRGTSLKEIAEKYQLAIKGIRNEL